MSNPLKYVDRDGNEPDDTDFVYTATTYRTTSYTLGDFFDLIYIREGATETLDSQTIGESDNFFYTWSELRSGETYSYSSGELKRSDKSDFKFGINAGSLQLYTQVSSEAKMYAGGKWRLDVGDTTYSINVLSEVTLDPNGMTTITISSTTDGLTTFSEISINNYLLMGTTLCAALVIAFAPEIAAFVVGGGEVIAKIISALKSVKSILELAPLFA